MLKNEIDEIYSSKKINLTLIYTLTRETDSDWTGERGRIDDKKIKMYVPQASEDVIVLTCGTTEMTQKNLVPLLKKMGYSPDNIFDF